MALKRLYQGNYSQKKPAVVPPSESLRNKYPTRKQTRTNEESSNNESKRQAMQRKVKEKEAIRKPGAPQMGMMGPGMPGGMPAGVPAGMMGAMPTGVVGGQGSGMMGMPFQIVGQNQQGGPTAMAGMFPMVQGLQQQGQK